MKQRRDRQREIFSRSAAFAASACAALYSLTANLAPSANAAGGDPSAARHDVGFEPYKDATAGFALSKPEGWHVRTQDLNIWVEGPDKSELVLVRAFTPEAGQSATDWLQTLGTQYDTTFPRAVLDHAERVPNNGDEVIADVHYDGPKGPAKLRLLCRIVDGKGLMYALAAPNDRYRDEQTKMLHVAQSIAFLPPKSSGGNGGGGAGAVTPAKIAAAARQLHWVKWTDPREGAFSMSVPQGWNVQGGTYRDQSDSKIVSHFYVLESPGKDITLAFGSPTYINFTTPSQMSAQFGWQEGTHGVMHFMQAPEFNKFYLSQTLSKVVSDLTPGKDAELVNKTTNENQTQTTVSVGTTEFKGRDAKTGKPLTGVILSRTTKMASQMLNGMPATWFADPTILATRTGDAHDAARVQTALAVFGHVQQSYRDDPQWTARYIQAWDAAQNKTHEQIMGDIAAAGERSKQIAANSDAQRNAIMGSYESHRAAEDNQQRNFINYLGDRTDVTDGAGHTANVAGGYSHYYRGQGGTVVGTNSAYSPGVDLTPMKEY